MASEEKQPLLAQAPMGAVDVEVACDGVREHVSTSDRKKIPMFCGETAAERKAFKMKVKSKKAGGRMAGSATLRAAHGYVDTATAPAKKVSPRTLGPLIRRPVLNAIVRSFYKFAISIFHQKDMKVVDDVLNDLPRATRSEPTAAILPKLEDRCM